MAHGTVRLDGFRLPRRTDALPYRCVAQPQLDVRNHRPRVAAQGPLLALPQRLEYGVADPARAAALELAGA